MKKLILPVAFLFFCCTSFHSTQLYDSPYYIVINKSKYELNVYDAKGWLVTYPVVFGNSDLRDKLYEGDKKTPEGTFTIISKKPHPKWDRFMMLNYPTQEDFEKFQERKNEGIIPENAKIGGGIGIHGTWPHEDFQINRYRNWTDGCISMRNEDVEELYNLIPVGTKVTIRYN
ncbi:MAG: L,D-transpeptidase [Bacteroidetes bacterium]|nr:L,D-transpeptidase [Bacteroidota bacterium]